MVQAALIAAGLLLAYWQAIRAYLLDQHYQEHFVYLWAFLALALWRSLRGPFRSRFGLRSTRDRAGLGLVLFGCVLLAASARVGSSTGMRTSLVAFSTGLALLVVSRWTIKRCLLHGLLMQLCFGLPYAVFQPLTARLQWGVAQVIALPVRLGLADYRLEHTDVVWDHFRLSITPECSGLGQLLTFLGIAALGILSADRNRRRSVLLLVLAVALSWLSNVARVATFVFLVGIGWTESVLDETWHAAVGTLAYLPFVLALVAVILRTHQAPSTAIEPIAPGRVPVATLLVPLLATWLAGGGAARELAEPGYFRDLSRPPAHRLEQRSPSEDADRAAYSTPWLLNARFRADDDRFFDLFHYATGSNSHLCVHKIVACIEVPEERVRYEPPVEIDGRRWWRISLDWADPANSTHVYFAFTVGDERHDDSPATQWEVFRRRLLHDDWEVRLSRVMFPGPLPTAPGDYERRVLTWLGRLTTGSR